MQFGSGGAASGLSVLHGVRVVSLLDPGPGPSLDVPPVAM